MGVVNVYYRPWLSIGHQKRFKKGNSGWAMPIQIISRVPGVGSHDIDYRETNRVNTLFVILIRFYNIDNILFILLIRF